MDDSSTTGAMTEIALALAMAFFCILVVALVSMGTPQILRPDAVALDTSAADAGTRSVAEGERLVMLFQGRFLDTAGIPVDPAAIDRDAPVVLAVDPSLALDRVLTARSAFGGERVRVTTLDPAWIAHFSQGASR